MNISQSGSRFARIIEESDRSHLIGHSYSFIAKLDDIKNFVFVRIICVNAFYLISYLNSIRTPNVRM